MPPSSFLEYIICDSIKEAVFGKFFNHVYIACAERTGAVIFQKELDFTRNRIVDILKNESNKSLSPFSFLESFSSNYPISIKRNVDIVRDVSSNQEESQLVQSAKGNDSDSIIAKSALRLFSEIIGGEYKFSKDGSIKYIQSGNKSIKLDMVESSSSIRGMLHLAIYLLYRVQKGDFLIIDEPEQNLHPDNQRKIAHLIALLINWGVHVFITTHSDYIVRELNALIVLHKKNETTESILREEGFTRDETLDAKRISSYLAQKTLITCPRAKRRLFCNTLIEEPVTPELGIGTDNFDDTIATMNRLYAKLAGLGDSND